MCETPLSPLSRSAFARQDAIATCASKRRSFWMPLTSSCPARNRTWKPQLAAGHAALPTATTALPSLGRRAHVDAQPTGQSSFVMDAAPSWGPLTLCRTPDRLRWSTTSVCKDKERGSRGDESGRRSFWSAGVVSMKTRKRRGIRRSDWTITHPWLGVWHSPTPLSRSNRERRRGCDPSRQRGQYVFSSP